MSKSFNSKPEPIAAKPKWHYDSYFLSQLERLNIRRLTHTVSNAEKMLQEVSEIKQSKEKAVVSASQESELRIRRRSEVIKRIYELADSIGISVTIIENPKMAV